MQRTRLVMLVVLAGATIGASLGAAGSSAEIGAAKLTVPMRSAIKTPFRLRTVDPTTGAASSSPSLIGAEPAWSPDGRWLAYRLSDRIWIWDIRTGRRSRVPLRWGRIGEPTWSPDSDELAFRCGNDLDEDTLCVMRLADRAIRRVRSFENFTFDYEWAPSGDRVAYVSTSGFDDCAILDVDVRSGKVRSLTRRTRECDSSPTYSPDGRRIAYAHCPGALRLIDANGGPSRSLAALGRRSCPVYLAWSPDGSTFALGYSSARSIWLLDGDGSNLRLLLNGPEHRGFAWTRTP